MTRSRRRRPGAMFTDSVTRAQHGGKQRMRGIQRRRLGQQCRPQEETVQADMEVDTEAKTQSMEVQEEACQ